MKGEIEAFRIDAFVFNWDYRVAIMASKKRAAKKRQVMFTKSGNVNGWEILNKPHVDERNKS